MKTRNVIALFTILCAMVLLVGWIKSVQAMEKPTEPLFLIHNTQFVDAIPLSEAGMQEILRRLPGSLKDYQIVLDEKSYSAARILLNASLGQGYTVNPRVLITILELATGKVNQPGVVPEVFDSFLAEEGISPGFGEQIRWLSDKLGESYLYYLSSLPTDQLAYAATYAIRDVYEQLSVGQKKTLYQDDGILIFSDIFYDIFNVDPRQPLQLNQDEPVPFLRKPINDQYEFNNNALHGVINSFFDHQLPLYSHNNDEVRLFSGETKPDDDDDSITDNQCDSAHLGYGATFACYDHHDGLDYDVANNSIEDIIAAANGIVGVCKVGVSNSGCDTTYLGNYIVITHALESTLIYRTVYAHLDSIGINPNTNNEWQDGEEILAGQVVGDGGCTGLGCDGDADHLHFVVYRNGVVVDPFGWLAADADPWVLDDRGAPSYWLWHASNITDDRDPAFESFGHTNRRVYADGWHSVDDGYGEHYWWVNSVAQQTNWGVWGLFVPQDGRYSVEAYIPQQDAANPWTTSARYIVKFRNVQGEFNSVIATLDQSLGQSGWYRLTRQDTGNEWFEFDGNRVAAVSLSDVTSDQGRRVVFDAVRLIADPVTAGLQYLRGTQDQTTGAWSNNVGITSLATLAFLNAGYDESEPVVSRAIAYILGFNNEDGTICQDCGHATYETSVALIALKAAHNSDYDDEINAARDWLVSSQWDENSLWGSITENDWEWGGFGYGSHTRPDLSNTQFALLALKAADLLPSDPTWSKAVKFVSRCQNRTASNDGYTYNNDGGFIYLPGWSATGGTESTGSMTGAGIWGLALSGLTTEDERFDAGLDWVGDNYTWEYNPLTDGSWGNNSLYYYYLSMAKALSMARKLTITTSDNQTIEWNSDLRATLERLQDPDQGFWVNSNSYLWENVPDLATSYALLALQTRQLPFGADLEMAIILHSPADLHLYDAYGRHVGKNYETGQVDLQIPGAEYLLSDPQIITVTPPVAGNYRVEMIGTQNGDWDLEVTGKQDDALVSYDIYSGVITTDEIKASDLNVGAFDGALTIFSTSPDNTPVIKLDPSRLDLRGYPGRRIQTSINITDAAGLDIPIKDISILPAVLKNESGVSIPVVITPTHITSIPVGGSQTVNLLIEVSDQPLGIYRGMMTIESLNAGVRSVEINLDIRELTPMYLPVLTNRLLIGFDSQFNSSTQGWEVQSGSWNVDENYYSTFGLDESWASTSYMGIFTNFNYQVRLQRSGCLECSNGIIVRGEPLPFGSENRWNSGYGFYINRTGRYSIFKYVNGNAQMLQDWTVSQWVNPGDDWNTLRLVANGDTMSFYINESWVWTGSDSSYNAGRVGIAMYRKVDSTGDYLQVDWAKLNPIYTTETQAFSHQPVNNVNDDLERLDDRFAP